MHVTVSQVKVIASEDYAMVLNAKVNLIWYDLNVVILICTGRLAKKEVGELTKEI